MKILSKAEVIKVLQETGIRFSPIDCLDLDDDAYFITSRKRGREFLQVSKVDEIRYLKRYFDCDDFRDVLYGEGSYYGICIGSVRGKVKGREGLHAFNIIVVENFLGNLEVWVVEPQDDSLYDHEEIEYITEGTIKSGRPEMIRLEKE